MKKRLSRVINFFAFNLLFFALYLNFIHKDKNVQQVISTTVHTPVATKTLNTNASQQFVQKEASAKNTASEKESTKALKLSFN